MWPRGLGAGCSVEGSCGLSPGDKWELGWGPRQGNSIGMCKAQRQERMVLSRDSEWFRLVLGWGGVTGGHREMGKSNST